MTTRKKGTWLFVLFLALMVAPGLIYLGCSDSSTSSLTTSTAGYEVPAEISAVPPSEGATGHLAAVSNLSLRGRLSSLVSAATDPGTDYSQATMRKYVEEHTLEQFEILEDVLNAIDQTHYADAGNINNGPYKCIVAWEEEEDGVDIKRLEPWVVDSEQLVENGQVVLRVRAWIEEEDEEETELVKAELKIYSPATRMADGSYQDYGVWTMNVKFDEAGTEDYFVASASVGTEGESILKIHEKFLDDMPGGPGELPELPVEFKAIMHRSDTAGYGKIDYPDFEALFGPDADPNLNALPHIEAKYAYNEDYLAVKEGDHDVQYKDRTTVTEMTHRYGVYHGDTGQDVMKIKSFGFPIRYTSNGLTRHAYYGAWQGRHQIWTHGEGDTIPEGTEVIREDTPPDEPPETYTVGDTFGGTLVRRTVVDADIDDIKGIPVEIWIDQDYHLLYDEGEGKWFYCTQMDWEAIPPECVGDSVDFDAEVGFESLIVGANDDRKHVNINRWDDTEGSKDYVYEAASADNGGQAGFYEASWGVNGKLTVNTPRVRLDPANNADERDLWVYIGGSLYVEYTGTGWVEKEVVSFNSMTWTPEFNEDGDKPYILPEGREYYVNMEGANYIVKRTGQTYITKREIQTAANPSNATTLVDAGTDLKDQWNPDGSSTYEFITDAGNENYLMLVYKTVGDNDKDPQGNDEAQVGAVVQRDLWGLQAYVNGAAQETMYSWEYRGENENWGSVTYLMDANGDYKLLDDPMRFDAITAANNAGEEKTLVLQYDGWMMGLPQMYEELMKNDWVMTDEIADKIINLPAGTEVIESDTGTSYLLKPLEISQFLNQVTDTIGLDLPDISEADTVDLGTVPDFVEHGMGDMPEVTTVKYSEGNLVE